MVTPTAGQVVVVPFPFSDLSQAKPRPVIVLANAGRGDWILCQVTSRPSSRPYGDPRAIRIGDDSLVEGTLQMTSYVRPSKLFTGNDALMLATIGKLDPRFFRKVISAAVNMINSEARQS